MTNLDLRAAGYVGAGYHLITTPVTTFDVFAGVGYNHFKYKGHGSDGAVELMLGEESARKLSDTTTFKQRWPFTRPPTPILAIELNSTQASA